MISYESDLNLFAKRFKKRIFFELLIGVGILNLLNSILQIKINSTVFWGISLVFLLYILLELLLYPISKKLIQDSIFRIEGNLCYLSKKKPSYYIDLKNIRIVKLKKVGEKLLK